MKKLDVYRNVCMKFKSEEDFEAFLHEAEKQGFNWIGGERPTKWNPLVDCEYSDELEAEDIYVKINCLAKYIHWNELSAINTRSEEHNFAYYTPKREGFTFKEVINRISPGEVYDNGSKIIEMNDEGDIFINQTFSTDKVVFRIDNLYTLKEAEKKTVYVIAALLEPGDSPVLVAASENVYKVVKKRIEDKGYLFLSLSCDGKGIYARAIKTDVLSLTEQEIKDKYESKYKISLIW